MKWLWLLVGFVLGCAVTAAAGLMYREYRRSKMVRVVDPFFEPCTPTSASSPYPLKHEKMLERHKDSVYIPPQAFDYDVNIEPLGGRYCIGWHGATRWFEYPPTAAEKDGDTLLVTLCLGGASRVSYRLRAVGQSLEFVD